MRGVEVVGGVVLLAIIDDWKTYKDDVDYLDESRLYLI